VPPSRDVRPRDAWPLPHGAWRRACYVLMPFCDVPQLSSTWNFLQRILNFHTLKYSHKRLVKTQPLTFFM
jgi:hypothetical protein